MTWHRPWPLNRISFLKGVFHPPRGGQPRPPVPTESPATVAVPPRVSLSSSLPPRRLELPAARTPANAAAATSSTAAGTHEVAAAKSCSPTAPIRVLDGEEARSAVDVFAASLGEWQPDPALLPSARFGRGPRPSPAQAAWHARLQDTDSIAPMLLDTGHEQRTLVAYFLGSHPVGLMSLKQPQPSEETSRPRAIEIHAIATHPGTEGAGGALIEHAVNASLQAGCGGHVRLEPLTDALGAYEALGFVQVDQDTLLLDPSRSDKWCQQDGVFRLRKNVDKNYLVSVGADLLSDAAARER